MKLAIVHDYLSQFGGAERVVCEMAEIFRDAPIYTSLYFPESTWPELKRHRIVTTWLQSLPGGERHFKALLPLYPLVFNRMFLSGYDVVISSSSSFAKGVSVAPGAVHICYCYTPTRFLWSFEDYTNRREMTLERNALLPFIGWLRRWDLCAARGPDYFLAISSAVKGRIERIYGRESRVIHPPVNVHRFQVCHHSEDFYLIVSRLLSYKRIDLAVETFNRLGLPLVIIGDGPDRDYLERLARPNITFTGYLADTEVMEYFHRCRGFIFPGEEDFGIAPLEANACGKPVIAYKAGGALDTLLEGKNGLFFTEQTPEALAATVIRSREIAWDPETIRQQAEAFCPETFRQKMLEFVREVGLRRASTLRHR